LSCARMLRRFYLAGGIVPDGEGKLVVDKEGVKTGLAYSASR